MSTQALRQICDAHGLSLPDDLDGNGLLDLLPSILSAITANQTRLAAQQSSVGHAMKCVARHCPNPGLERTEQLGAVSEPDRNRCLDPLIPGGLARV